MVAVVNRERGDFREAEDAADRRHRSMAQELTASTQEVETMSSRLRAISEERASMSHRRHPCSEQPDAKGLPYLEAQASEEVRQL